MARLNKAVQVLDPEDSAQTEDPLWAPSWPLPSKRGEARPQAAEDRLALRLERDPGQRAQEAATDDG